MIDEFDISQLDMADFPFQGAFFTYKVDMDAPLNERVPKEVLVFETPCDVQKRAGLRQGSFLGAEYTVYFPLKLNPESTGTVDKFGPVKVRRGMTFKANGYGYKYEGIVEMIRMSQLGGCSVDIRVKTEADLIEDMPEEPEPEPTPGPETGEGDGTE